MFKSSIYTPRKCEKGIPITFNRINISSDKITDIRSTQISNNIAEITVASVNGINVGESINIISNGTIDNIYLGNHVVTSVNADTNVISYRVYGVASDFVILTESVSGSVYSVPTIEDSPNGYRVNFTIQSSVPGQNTNKITTLLTPPSYPIQNANVFTPETTVSISSNYTDTSKAFVKVSITNLTNDTIVYTDYQEVVCSKSLNRPCQIIFTDAQRSKFTDLTIDNNWSYKNQNYQLLQFIPYNDVSQNFILEIPSKNPASLPNNLIPKYRVSIDRNQIGWYGANGFNGSLDIEDIREVFYEYGVEADEQIGDPYSFVIAGISDINKIKATPVGYYYNMNPPQPITLGEILIRDENQAIVKIIDKYEIPNVAKLVIQHNDFLEYLGELIFIKSIYYKDDIKIVRTIDGEKFSFCGNILPLTEGLTVLSAADCE